MNDLIIYIEQLANKTLSRVEYSEIEKIISNDFASNEELFIIAVVVGFALFIIGFVVGVFSEF